MTNLLLFVFNTVIALIALAFTIVWFVPGLILRGLNAGYRKLLGLDT